MINQPKIQHEDNLTTRERWLSMLLDHAIFCFILVPTMILLSSLNRNMDNNWSRISFLFMIVVYFNKDILAGRSPAKRILGQLVIDKKTGKPASAIKCLIRNFMIPFWMIEVLVVRKSPSRRVGDILAGTITVRAPKSNIQGFINDFRVADKRNLVLSIVLGIIYTWSFFYVIDFIIWNIRPPF